MLSRILPRRIDSDYRGYKLAIWVLVALVFVKTGITLGSIFNGRVAAQSADGIPLDTFTNGGAETVLALFAALGLSHLVLSVFGMLALVRYRAMIPFMYVLLLLEHLARKWIALLSLMIIGLALSLRSSSRSSVEA